MAYGVRNFGLNASLTYLLENWSPSIYYLWLLLPWKFDLPSTLISSMLGMISFLLAATLFYKAISSIVTSEIKLKQTQVISYLVLGLISSLTLVQSSVYFMSESAKNFQVKYVIIEWIKANWFQFRDGQILRWSFATPLTSLKLVMSALIIYFLALVITNLEKNQINQLIIRIYLATLISLTFGLNHEVITFLAFVTYISVTQFIRGQKRFVFSVHLLITILGIAALYKSPGSSRRLESITSGPTYNFFALLVGNIWQLSWVTLTVFATSYITHLGYSHSRNHANFTFSEVTRKLIRALAVISVLSQVVLETLSYPAAYHWISYILIIFLYFFVEMCNSTRSKPAPRTGRISSKILFNSMAIFTMISIIMTIGVASERYSDWNFRSNLSKESNSQIDTNIPHLDNLGNVYAEDLDVDYGSIVPLHGFRQSFTSFCFNRLAIGF
jgi:hypothetical protein